MHFFYIYNLFIFQEEDTIKKLEQSKCLLEQEIVRTKKVLESTQSQLDILKAEKKNLAVEVTESVAKIASLEDELADEKLKHEHSSLDLQEQLDKERKLRRISEERLAHMRARHDKELSNSRTGNASTLNNEKKSVSGVLKNKSDHQLLIEVSKLA